jgi:hypothetical protein
MQAEPRFFSLLVPNGSGIQFWCVNERNAYRVGAGDPRTAKNCFIQIDPAKDLAQQFAAAFPFWPGLNLHEIPLPPGGYYARMARPTTLQPDDFPRFPTHSLYINEISGTVGQLISLVEKLRGICQVVEPVPENLDAFGHAIRECLIIACTEVESHWKAVLSANGMMKDRYTTNDYIKTLLPLKLDQYEVELLKFPLCGRFSPFRGWDASAPTTTLAFYDAYNAVKHDREKEFSRATLRHSLEATCACFIMAIAQFGYSSVVQKNRDILEFFRIAQRPSWSPSEVYCNEAEDFTPSEFKYPF